MILINKSGRVIFAGPYKLIPLFPVKVSGTKSAFFKTYPRIRDLAEAGVIDCATPEKAEKTEAERKEKTAALISEAKKKEAKKGNDAD